MNHTGTSTTARRKATNVSLNPDYLAEARELGINISKACENGLVQAVKEVRGARWIEENREALDSFNTYIEQHGLPLEKYRLF
jgi:antitoxin CcdA